MTDQDPLRRATDATRKIKHAKRVIAQNVPKRVEAVLELRQQGWTYRQLEEALGIGFGMLAWEIRQAIREDLTAGEKS